MGMDIRLPIGLMFSLFGVMLAAFGGLGDKSIYARSLGININLTWGVILLVFGLMMLVLGTRRASVVRDKSTAHASPEDRVKAETRGQA